MIDAMDGFEARELIDVRYGWYGKLAGSRSRVSGVVNASSLGIWVYELE